MATPYKLPEIAESIVEAEIGRWLKKEGEFIKKEEPFLEILTDKVNVELPSPYEGYLIKILKKEGEIVKVGEIIAYFGEKEEKIKEEKEVISEEITPKKEPIYEEIPSQEILAPPGVRKRARELGIDLNLVKGTGPGGRIKMEDLDKFISEKEEPLVEKIVFEKEITRIPFKGIRRQIGEHLIKSKEKAVHTLHIDEADVSELVKFAQKIKESEFIKQSKIKLTYLPFIIQSCIQALKKFPQVNSSLDEEKGEILIKNYYNIGIAVETENGLLVPNIKEADKKDIFQLAREIEILSSKAREGKLRLEDVQNGTFSITNIGGIGGLFSFPVINYPEVAILGISRIKKRPWVVENRIEIRDIMYLSLSFDHRVIDGAEAAVFLREVIKYLESPILLYFKEV